MNDLISRQAALDVVENYPHGDWNMQTMKEMVSAIDSLPSAQSGIIRCKDCKHNPKLEWFGCPMSHLNEKQRPETAWCWKGERKDDE